jgi:glycine C-acetyltransferase
MGELPYEWTGDPELVGLAEDFVETEGADLLARWARHQAFWDARLNAGLDPYSRTVIGRVGPSCAAITRGHERIEGVNFASQDYLSLSSHPLICAAAAEAIRTWGVHSAGPSGLQGGSPPLLMLEERLSDLLTCREVAVFSSGWAAAYGVITALVRPTDHVVIDVAAATSLQDGATKATRNIHRFPNCAYDMAAERLAAIRERDAHRGILVITASLFPMDGTVPNLRAMQNACREHEATLLVDVAHDLGAIGDGGLGYAGEQGMAGELDLITGSFAPTFASSGGFVASNASGFKQALRTFAHPLYSSNALSPVQAAAVNAALDIVRSREGAERRNRLMRNVVRLREALLSRAFSVLGQPGPIVPVSLGGIACARLLTRAVLARGALINMVEHPAVPRQNSRWRLQVMADHSHQQIDQLVSIAAEARESIA